MSNNVETTIGKFLAINLETLRINTIYSFDLYLHQAEEYILYRAVSQPFTKKHRDNLIANRVTKLFIRSEDNADYQKYIESNLKTIIEDQSIKVDTKALIVYESTQNLVKEVLKKPTLKRNIERSQKLVETTVGFILHEEDAFYNLLRMMSFDYYTYTHSVNVCTFSIALAQYAGITNDWQLQKLGTGALLHDVGKTRIPEAILNKTESLTDEEKEMIHMHPAWGVEMIRESNLVAEEVYYPIEQHHEREDGSGYSKGLMGSEIHEFSKIVAIADVFDAMTTNRTYCQAIDSFTALKRIFENQHHYDKRYLEMFTLLMGKHKK